MRYRLSQIAALCEGEMRGCDCEVCALSTDSRNCEADHEVLFVAIEGRNHDSHDFVEEMVRRGVRAFMVERPVDLPEGCGQVIVSHSVTALQRLAADYRRSFRGRVVAITGSNGKTMVKEWLARVLPEEIRVFRSPKSYNSQLGVPLSLLMARGDEELWLIEAGISQKGEMALLEEMIRPDMVLLTSLGEAHQENFSSMEEKATEKLLLAKRASRILYHRAYPLWETLIWSMYGDRKRIDAADYPLCQLPIEMRNEAARINASLVAAAARELGYDADLSLLEPIAMRLELKEGINKSLLIDDTYVADLNSLKIALDYLHNVAMGRPTTLILSDIEQSGRRGEELYREVAALVARAGVNRLIGVGEGLRSAAEMFHLDKSFYSTTEALIRHLRSDDFAGRVVLIKGSRKSRFERVVHALERRSHTTTLEVDLDAMVHNLNYFRHRLRPGVKLVAMVKAASYGAGDFEVAQMLHHQGVDYLAVAFADEGVLLRERGISMPIVVLNADEGSFGQMIRYRLEPEIYNFRSLHYFCEAVRRAGEENYPIHLKLDTGMHRLGFVEEELAQLCAILPTLGEIRVATLFSHLNCSDTPSEDDYSRAQIARYDRMSQQVQAALPYTVIRHTAQSAAIDRFPEAQFDMCRLGLGLYGFGFQHNPLLRPVSTLRTRIVQLKSLKKGECVGYGRAGKLERDSVTATIPIGYADGLDRHLGEGRWAMLVAGQRAPVVGRICMDSCMIDVTDIPNVQEGDEVVVFSPIKGNDLETMAHLLGTIPYEIMTSISGRVKRIYIKE